MPRNLVNIQVLSVVLGMKWFWVWRPPGHSYLINFFMPWHVPLVLLCFVYCINNNNKNVFFKIWYNVKYFCLWSNRFHNFVLTLLLLVQIYDQTIEATLNQSYGGLWLLTAILHSNLIPHMSVGFSGLFQSVYKLHVTENPNGCWRLAMVHFVQVSLAGGDLLLGVCL